MPKVKIKAGDFSGVDAAKGFAAYSGPKPPKGVYKCKVKIWNLKINSSGDQMFKILLEIDEPKGSKKAKFNGYPMWHQANLTEKSAPFVNAMLDAMKVSRKAVWSVGVVTEQGGDINAKMGTKVTKIAGKSPVGIEVLVVTKIDNYNDDSKQVPASFLVVPEGYGSEAEEAGDTDAGDEDDEDEDDEDSEDSDDDDEDDSDSDDDDDEDDEDDGDEF